MFGDSNCLDSSHQHHNCFDFLSKLVEQLAGGQDAGLAQREAQLGKAYSAPGFSAPKRRDDLNFSDFSFVLRNPLR